MEKILESEKINRAINFLIIGLIWKQCNGNINQDDLSEKFELGINAYTELRNQGKIFNHLGRKRCNDLANRTGVKIGIFTGEIRIGIREVQDEDLEKYLYTLRNIQFLKETLSIAKEGKTINRNDISMTLKKDLSSRMIKNDTREEIDRGIADRKWEKKNFEARLNKAIKNIIQDISEVSEGSSNFEKLIYYIKMGERYGNLSYDLDKTVKALEKTNFTILEKAPLSQLEKYVSLLRTQFKMADALITVRKEKSKKE